MEIRVLGCSGGRSPGLELTSYLIDETILIDAGSASCSLDLEEQETISDVLITHSHLDHIIGLGFIYQNTVRSRVRPLSVYATEPVLADLREHLFNPALLSVPEDLPRLNFHPISVEIPFRLGHYEIEAVAVDHCPGSVGYRVSDSMKTFVFSGDTGEGGNLWNWLGRHDPPDSLVAEISFPDHMKELARQSSHLTPAMLCECLDRAGLPPDYKVNINHLKPAFLEDLFEEIEHCRDRNLVILRKGDRIVLEEKLSSDTVLRQTEERVADKVPEFDASSDLYHQRDRLEREFGVQVKKDELIFSQGDRSRVMYIVREGKIRIHRRAGGREKTLSYLGPGDFFGEMAMLNNRPRSASATAVTGARLLAFDKPAFENMVKNNFGVAFRIIRTLTQRLQEADTLIENLLYIDPESKVINTLIQTAYDEGIETDEGFLVRTNPENISDRSGVIPSTLRDIFSGLVERELIELRKEAIIIPDVQKLRRLLKFIELKNEFGY
ncbi:MAG: cyclic nucleotide-binding domain-containing protein [bacterium]